MTCPADRHRSFIAIPLPQPLQQQISALQKQLRKLTPELKPTKVENLHLTLHFLGDLTHEQLAEIGQNMLSISKKKKNFNVVLEGLGFFPNRRKPRVFWLGIKPEQDLSQLYQELKLALDRLEITTETRPYRPHLTIGRFRQQPKDTSSLCPFLSHKCGSLKIDRMVLYTSKLTLQGAIHTPLTTALLAGKK